MLKVVQGPLGYVLIMCCRHLGTDLEISEAMGLAVSIAVKGPDDIASQAISCCKSFEVDGGVLIMRRA